MIYFLFLHIQSIIADTKKNPSKNNFQPSTTTNHPEKPKNSTENINTVQKLDHMSTPSTWPPYTLPCRQCSNGWQPCWVSGARPYSSSSFVLGAPPSERPPTPSRDPTEPQPRTPPRPGPPPRRESSQMWVCAAPPPPSVVRRAPLPRGARARDTGLL